MQVVEKNNPGRYAEIVKKTNLDTSTETGVWKSVAGNLHLPYNEEEQVFLQQDGYMDKEQITADELSPSIRLVNQHWSWDRILRSCFIKQADTLQGVYLFEEEFDKETIRRNFAFYEPRTVHESSLSPCVHGILAARLGDTDKAYEMYLRTSRLDIDDYNNEVHEGLHITSMAEWNKRINLEYPHFNIVGEAWIGEAAKLCYWQKDFPNSDGYNSHMKTLMDFP